MKLSEQKVLIINILLPLGISVAYAYTLIWHDKFPTKRSVFTIHTSLLDENFKHSVFLHQKYSSRPKVKQIN